MEYVSLVKLEVNGKNIDDFKSVEEEEIELNKEVNLMHKTGSVGVTQRYKVNVDYVVPKDSPEFDFAAVKDGTLTIDYDNGTRIQFTGVTVLKIGATSFDGEKEATRKISFMATGKS
ncbi:MAG: hypothetical protein A3J24_06420 [Deltaproteobacteria bacterium RIFCSPLOWO2_02_FULL_53_8]|nr:MAG: hypothetical protein A3J24_06420 [Deltaproteobacteria bacterium RIFCSPLOWO2_02_FULL_53_8]